MLGIAPENEIFEKWCFCTFFLDLLAYIFFGLYEGFAGNY